MASLIVLRILHIGFGVFWVGGVLLMNFLVGPSLAAAGPDGMKVMKQLNQRRYFDVMLVSGLITILAGLDLLRRDSAGFTPSWFRTGFGTGIAVGMVAAICAWLLGLTVVKPAMKKMSALGMQMAQAGPNPSPELAAEFTAARGRMITLGGIGAMLLIVAVLAMATARYL